MSGHRRRDPNLEKFWRTTLAAWAKSGESVREFCASRGLAQANFYSWRRTILERDQEGRTKARPVSLVPLRVVPDTVLEVVLAADLTVRVPVGTDASAVASLVAALRAASC